MGENSLQKKKTLRWEGARLERRKRKEQNEAAEAGKR